MKKLLLVVPLLFLTGCFYQTIDMETYTKAEYFCKDKSGIKTLTEYWTGQTEVTCHDGTLINLVNIKFNHRTMETIK